MKLTLKGPNKNIQPQIIYQGVHITYFTPEILETTLFRNDFTSLSFNFRNGDGTGNEKLFPLSLLYTRKKLMY